MPTTMWSDADGFGPVRDMPRMGSAEPYKVYYSIVYDRTCYSICYIRFDYIMFV